MVCFLIYITQAYLVLRALGASADPGVVLLYPLVLLANLVPITVGGYGVREALAVVVLQLREIPEAKAAASVAVVTFFDLVVPGLVGVVLRGLGKVPPSNEQEPSAPETTPVPSDEWDDFWEARTRRWVGRLVAWVRRRFVTTKLATYIRENTEKGTLVEAGCGSGEIALRVAAERGDDVVLVDYSPKALALAGRLARSYGIDARLVECDVAELGAHVRPAPDTTVFNVGVVEHFPDPSGVLREMAHVSGRDALAVIPERSAFWLVFIRIARLLGLVPRDFFVQFFDRKRLAAVVSEANLQVRWMRTVRILGVIPYLGVSYGLVRRRESRHHADVLGRRAVAQYGDSCEEEIPTVEVTQ
jgi:2-polyprenyl-3-methyl-5-hydroxy-6-metoxy-1,4-benzoquinol methylase